MHFDMSGFDGRENALRGIKRWDMEKRTPMFYRTNDLIHSQRVHFLLVDILSEVVAKLNGDFNTIKALTLALVHDDAEIITGDVQLYYKERMAAEELAKIYDNEEEAIEILYERWPKRIGDFFYRNLLLHALKKDCIEAQTVSFCDKLDGYCESLHEVFAGNPRFIGPAKNYVSKIINLREKFTDLNMFFPGKHPLLQIPEDRDLEEILRRGQLHSIESVDAETGILQYDRWKRITVDNFGYEPLINIKEQ